MSTEINTKTRPWRVPWNKGRLIGQKRPLRPKDVWAIRVRLQIKHNKRDLAMFNLAIDSKLRGCDLVSLRVDDIAVGAHVRDRATIVQHKTGRPVQFEITEQTRASLEDWLKTRPADRGPHVFPSRVHKQPHVTARQYARTVDQKPTLSISIGMGGESHKAVLGANARVGQVQSVVVFQKEFSRTDLVCRANADVWLGRFWAAFLFDSEFASTAVLRAAPSSTKRRLADARARSEPPSGALTRSALLGGRGLSQRRKGFVPSASQPRGWCSLIVGPLLVDVTGRVR